MHDHLIRSNSPSGQQPAYDEKQEIDRAQNKAPETQVERPEQSACVGLSEHLIRKQLQSKTDEEQPALRNRIRSSFKPAPTRKSLMGLPQWRWAAVAASLALVSVLTWRVAPFLPTETTDDQLIQEVTASHVRSSMVSHLVDIPSSDRHVVKPWFTGKLDFAPSVADLTEQGFPLVGGRLDYVSGRAVAGLVYKRREHVINVFLWPSAVAVETRSLAHQGYHLVCWTQSGMTYWAISDLNSRELQEFVHHLQSPPSR
ncbi:MAG: anti-sigma factor [Nitrospira sp.]|nr:anti-sigma factor [Nitrospira sp.]